MFKCSSNNLHLGADYMRQIDPVLARLNWNLFLNTTRQLQKFSSNTIITKIAIIWGGLKTGWKRVGSLASWLVFPTRANALEASWRARVIAYPGSETGWRMRSSQILNNNSFFPGWKRAGTVLARLNFFHNNSELEPGWKRASTGWTRLI